MGFSLSSKSPVVASCPVPRDRSASVPPNLECREPSASNLCTFFTVKLGEVYLTALQYVPDIVGITGTGAVLRDQHGVESSFFDYVGVLLELRDIGNLQNETLGPGIFGLPYTKC